MKLQDIFENENKNLLLDMSFYSPRTAPRKHQYVISDVPPISIEQFLQLYNTSFNTDHQHHRFSIGPTYNRYTTRDRQQQNSFVNVTMNTTGDQPNVKTMKWKEFVEEMKAAYPYESTGDDFSE